MPLPNRVTPEGRLEAVSARGLLMGNRGGRIHDPATQRPVRRQASRRWICCVPAFKGRRRTVWGRGYTELFFCDEPTALAAGHRPCVECRRADAHAWRAAAFRDSPDLPPFDAIDLRLAAERSAGERPRARAADLPDGAFVLLTEGVPAAVREATLLVWSHGGYGQRLPPPAAPLPVLTPATSLAALAGGYSPLWHPSAGPR